MAVDAAELLARFDYAAQRHLAGALNATTMELPLDHDAPVVHAAVYANALDELSRRFISGERASGQELR